MNFSESFVIFSTSKPFLSLSWTQCTLSREPTDLYLLHSGTYARSCLYRRGSTSCGSCRNSTCQRSCWCTPMLPSLNLSSPPPSPAGTVLPLPGTRVDCSISFAVTRRLPAAICYTSRTCTRPFYCDNNPHHPRNTNSVRHCLLARGCCPSNLTPQKQFLHCGCQSHQQDQRPPLPLNSHAHILQTLSLFYTCKILFLLSTHLLFHADIFYLY